MFLPNVKNLLPSSPCYSCVNEIPHLPTSVVLHDDRQNGYGCSGSRPRKPSIQSEMATVDEIVEMMNTLQRQQHALNQEILRLTAENQQFRQAGSPGLAGIATAAGQAVQTATSNANPRPKWTSESGRHQGSWKTSNVQERICEIHRVAQEDHRVSDWCVWLSIPASDWMGGRSRQRHHERRTRPTVRSAGCRTSWRCSGKERTSPCCTPGLDRKWKLRYRSWSSTNQDSCTWSLVHEVRSEIQAYIEARRSQFAFKTVGAKNTSGPMDVDSFGKCRKKSGKGKVMARMWGRRKRRRRRHSPCSWSSAGFAWRSVCRAQSTARSAGGGRKRRRQGRTGGSRRGEANSRRDPHEHGWQMIRLRSWANEVHVRQDEQSVTKIARSQCMLRWCACCACRCSCCSWSHACPHCSCHCYSFRSSVSVAIFLYLEVYSLQRTARMRHRSKPESESKSQQGLCLLVEPKESLWLPRRPKQRRQKKTEERQKQRSGLFDTKRLLRALWTWHHLKHLEDYRTWIPEVGWDGHTTRVRRFRHFFVVTFQGRKADVHKTLTMPEEKQQAQGDFMHH